MTAEDVGGGKGPQTQTGDWAAIFAGAPAEGPDDMARRAVLDAWREIASADLRRTLRRPGDGFMTTAFWGQVRAWEGWLDALEPVFARLAGGELGCAEAMSQVARAFGGDPARLRAWKEQHANLAALGAWIPRFEHIRDYLETALPTGNEPLERRRTSLLDRSTRPHELILPEARETFNRDFEDYRRPYADVYCERHEEALEIAGGAGRGQARVDAVALRNLELLSRLHHTDKSYVNRVRIIGKWVRTNQCSLPVRAILERVSRCYCNFNPAGSRLTDSVAQVNRIIEEGITYFRSVLRGCNLRIIQELQAMHADDTHSGQIAALLSRGPMAPLKPRSIEILNHIIDAHTDEFMAAIRAYKPR